MAYEEKLRAPEPPRHTVVMEGRRRVSVSGVADVESFDEAEVVMATSQGALVVKGAELRIEKLSLETGDVVLEGIVDRLEYENDVPERTGGFFSRLFG